MEVFVKIVQFLLSLTIIVLVHELGHFLFARLFKTRVEKFRLFFDYKFALWKKKIGETEFGIGWIPLGGYVKIAGMIDESMDREQMKKSPQPWEFRSKPAWQRLLIMIAGVLFNLLFAWFLFAATLHVWGEEYLPNDKAVNGVVCTKTAQEIGFKNGDKIINVYGKKIERFGELNAEILLNAPGEVLVMRGGETTSIYVRSDEVGSLVNGGGVLFTSPRAPFRIEQLLPEGGAFKGGLKPGDELITFNGEVLHFFDEFVSHFKNHTGETVEIGVKRGEEIISKNVVVDSLGRIGVGFVSPYRILETKSQNYTFLASIPLGLSKAKNTISDYLKQLKLLSAPEVDIANSIGGPIAIAGIFPSSWNWEILWNLTAFLSIVIGIMNLLPIPALDGGHVMILLFEVITRRKPSQRFLEVIQIIGLVLIMSLFLFVMANDLIKVLW